MARALPKKLRFEILKRDEFKCRYCGRTEADGATLHVDHVVPVSLGGRNDPENLATACADCNLGKSAAMLNDPRLIGIDFTERKKVFELAEQSLDRYREYIKAKESWEYSLVSALIDPFRGVFGPASLTSIGPEETHWCFVPTVVTPADLPDYLGKDVHFLNAINSSLSAAEARVRRSVLYFFEKLGPESVRGAAKIAAEKCTVDEELDEQAAFRYFCGICHKRISQAGLRPC